VWACPLPSHLVVHWFDLQSQVGWQLAALGEHSNEHKACNMSRWYNTECFLQTLLLRVIGVASDVFRIIAHGLVRAALDPRLQDDLHMTTFKNAAADHFVFSSDIIETDCTLCTATADPRAAVRAAPCSSVSSQRVNLTIMAQLAVASLQEQLEPIAIVAYGHERQRSHRQQPTRLSHALLCRPGGFSGAVRPRLFRPAQLTAPRISSTACLELQSLYFAC
jgi:hypothetical protein